MNEHGKSKSKLSLQKALNIFLASLTFILLQYMLACWTLSFKSNVLSIFYLVINFIVINELWRHLSRTLNSKFLCFIILAVNVFIVAMILLIFGYFPVSTTLH